MEFDVVVAGGGNAGLVSAITACERGRSVLLVEKAPAGDRGGNSKYTRDFRVAHGPGQLGLPGEYSTDEFLEDLVKVTHGQTNLSLARYVVENSQEVVKWATDHGVKWQAAISSALHLSRTNIFILGGGKALLNAYYRRLQGSPKCRVIYESELISLDIEGRASGGRNGL